MSKENVLLVENVSKKFCYSLRRGLVYGSMDLGRHLLGISAKRNNLRPQEFWALSDVSFHLEKGEILGVIGANGAGKSTLLRVLNGIYPPDTGRVEITGRIGGLIALGAGFHPHFTGRENIYLNGAILGMAREEIEEKLESIIAFSELGSFIEAPVNTYSSGMYVRLGFAIAIHSIPDILLIDEVLSVGDLSFQNKCLRKITELRNNAKAVIFIGHNMDYVKMLCSRVVLLDKGKVLEIGKPDDVVRTYSQLAAGKSLAWEKREVEQEVTKIGVQYSRDIIFHKFRTLNEQYQESTLFEESENITIEYEFTALKDIHHPFFAFGFRDLHNLQWNVAYEVSEGQKFEIKEPVLAGQKYNARVTFQKPNLMPGVYRLNFCFWNFDDLTLTHDVKDEIDFKVAGTDVAAIQVKGQKFNYHSVVHFPTRWTLQKA